MYACPFARVMYEYKRREGRRENEVGGFFFFKLFRNFYLVTENKFTTVITASNLF